ncbi:MAG: acylphosphatase [Acidimicrobiales bacterium]
MSVPAGPAADGAVRRRVTVTGRVQAVGFRYSCRGRALDAELGGWVRNLADGRVEAAFEGPPPSVAALVRWCATGPPLARVTDVTVTDEPPVGETAFVIR